LRKTAVSTIPGNTPHLVAFQPICRPLWHGREDAGAKDRRIQPIGVLRHLVGHTCGLSQQLQVGTQEDVFDPGLYLPQCSQYLGTSFRAAPHKYHSAASRAS
jgi:hypothetical protein